MFDKKETKYIEKEVMINKIMENAEKNNECILTMEDALEIPTAKITVVHNANWVKVDEGDYRCSHCGENPMKDLDLDAPAREKGYFIWDFRPKFCPNCGAEMSR